jgi:hypothetical protein
MSLSIYYNIPLLQVNSLLSDLVQWPYHDILSVVCMVEKLGKRCVGSYTSQYQVFNNHFCQRQIIVLKVSKGTWLGDVLWKGAH